MQENRGDRFCLWCSLWSFRVFMGFMLFVLIVGGVYVYQLGSLTRFWDEDHYLALVQHLKAGLYSFDGVESTAFQPPGYPLTLYIFSLLSSSLPFLRYANFIFFAIALLCMYRILNKNISLVAGIIGVGIAALYPVFYYSSGAFYPQMLGAALMLCCFCLVDQLRTPKIAFELLLGCLYGWLILVIPVYGFYLPCLAFYPWILNLETAVQDDKVMQNFELESLSMGGDHSLMVKAPPIGSDYGSKNCVNLSSSTAVSRLKRPKKIRAACLLLLGASLVVGCWTVRNAITFHAFIPISTNGGVNILLGNNENMTPDIGVNADIHAYQKVASDMSEGDKDGYYQKVAFQWIYHHPGKAIENYFLKALNYFDYTNKLAQESEQTPIRDFVLFVTYYPLLLLAILRLCFAWKYPLQDMEKLIVIFFIASPFIHALFFTRLRFRVPFDFLTIMLAASFISHRLQGVAKIPRRGGWK